MPYMSKEQQQANTLLTGGNPWVAAARMIVKGATSPLTESDSSSAQSINDINKAQGQQQGMQMQSAPDSPQKDMGAMGEFGDSLLPGSARLIGQNTQIPGSIAGGFSVQPTNVDSSKQQYSSGLQDYLNYMKYRGGY